MVQAGMLIAIYIRGKIKAKNSKTVQIIAEANMEQLEAQRKKNKQLKIMSGWMISLLSFGVAWGVRDWLDLTVGKRDAWVLPMCLSYLLIFIMLFIYSLKAEVRIREKMKQLR